MVILFIGAMSTAHNYMQASRVSPELLRLPKTFRVHENAKKNPEAESGCQALFDLINSQSTFPQPLKLPSHLKPPYFRLLLISNQLPYQKVTMKTIVPSTPKTSAAQRTQAGETLSNLLCIISTFITGGKRDTTKSSSYSQTSKTKTSTHSRTLRQYWHPQVLEMEFARCNVLGMSLYFHGPKHDNFQSQSSAHLASRVALVSTRNVILYFQIYRGNFTYKILLDRP
ncbi:hypothetical protein EAF04_006645 [Stromatinia cepivora]|nr:hypothetical protein EAF04_006645 [Stromatinia cepivora]